MRRLVAQLTVAVAVVVMAVPASADDATIAKQIVAKLNQQKQAANLKGFDLGVQVDQGTVTMMGNQEGCDTTNVNSGRQAWRRSTLDGTLIAAITLTLTFT